MDNWRKVPWLAIEAAKREIDELTSRLDHESDLRKRVKSARRLAFVGSSLAFSNEPLDIATIDAGITALSKARRFGAVTDDLNRSVAMLTQLKLEATGRSGFKVLAEKKKVVAVNAACLAAAGRKELDPNAWAAGPVPALKAMARGDFFLVETGVDGHYALTLRITDAAELILNSTEYKFLDRSTDVGIVRIEHSEIRFGAPEDLEAAAVLLVPNGLLKVQLYCLCRPKSVRFVLVGCSTLDAPPPLDRIPEIR